MTIIIKTEGEIKAMREGGKILANLLEEIRLRAQAGISTYELDEFAEKFIKKHNANPGFKGYKGFPATICATIDAEIVHGIPNKNRYLKEGDLFTVDCGVIYEGLYTDAARSMGIGKISEEKEKLIEVAKRTLKEAIRVAKPGVRVGKIGETVEKIVKGAGFNVIKDLTGHGIGKDLHEDPVVLNYKSDNPGPILKPGMTIAIEPIFTTGRGELRESKDNWTLITSDGAPSVQEENTILITQKSNEILTCI